MLALLILCSIACLQSDIDTTNVSHARKRTSAIHVRLHTHTLTNDSQTDLTL